MKNNLDFLRKMMEENKNFVPPGLSSIISQFDEIARIQSKLIGNSYLSQIADTQKKLSRTNRNFALPYQKLAQSISIQQQYNLAGLTKISSSIPKMSAITSLPLDSFTKTISAEILELNFKFSQSFQTVAKVLSNQNTGIPKNVVNELQTISSIAISDLEAHEDNFDERLRTLEKSIEIIATEYEAESIKKYSLGEVIQTLVVYLSFILAIYNTTSIADEEILSHQKILLEQQHEMEVQLDSLLSSNQELYGKIYQIELKELTKFRITNSSVLVRANPNDTSDVKFKLDINSVCKAKKQKSKFIKITHFDFENNKTLSGWIPVNKTIELDNYLE